MRQMKQKKSQTITWEDIYRQHGNTEYYMCGMPDFARTFLFIELTETPENRACALFPHKSSRPMPGVLRHSNKLRTFTPDRLGL
jgi:ribosome-interacting GTPase 1